MAKKTKEDALKTRQLLINTAIMQFAQRGVSNTSLDDIASAAQVTRGAIYWHFTNKIELFNAIWQQQLPMSEKITNRIKSQFPDNAPLVLRNVFVEFLRLISRDPIEQALIEILYHKCEFTNGMTSEKEIREKLLFNRNNARKLLHNCLREDPTFINCDIELALLIIQAYISGVVKNWLMLNKNFDLYALAPTLVDRLLDMLRAYPVANALHPAVFPALSVP